MEPVVTRCGHLFCWSCLHQWLSAPSSASFGSGSLGVSAVAANRSTGSACPICKASVTMQNVIPVYTRGNHTDPRNTFPDLPARPPGERPEPEPASVLAMHTFANGGVPDSYGYVSGDGYFPLLFGLNCQGVSSLQSPSSRRTSHMIMGLALLCSLVVFLI